MTASSRGGSGARDECVYCGRLADTRDHVPAKSLFPRPRPSDLITVPSCARCNAGASIDEDYFLGLNMFGAAALSDAGRTLWQQTLQRTFRRNVGLRNRLAAGLVQVRIRTPAGLHIGTRDAIEIDHERLNQVVRKVIRGLYYHEFHERLLNDTRVECMRLDTQEAIDRIAHLARDVRVGTRDWPGLFEYRRNRVRENPQGSLWFIRFYGVVHYWGFTTP